MNKSDLRVIKTERNIQGSFLKLLEKKSFSEITVQDILDEALINRTTFYRHYDSKYDLVSKLNETVMARFEQLLTSSLKNRSNPDLVFKSVEGMAENFRKDRNMIIALWRVRDEENDLYSEMERLMRDKFGGFLRKSADSEGDDIEYQTAIMTSMILTTFRYLLESEETHSVKELTTQVNRLIRKHLLQV
ncbi:MAG: TetR/AcrR family transcriptional regulator [Firmicutes bacterium]|nr:TetR/AcrR family transcriptional regulator [Bacillota bacterium]